MNSCFNAFIWYISPFLIPSKDPAPRILYANSCHSEEMPDFWCSRFEMQWTNGRPAAERLCKNSSEKGLCNYGSTAVQFVIATRIVERGDAFSCERNVAQKGKFLWGYFTLLPVC